MRNNRRWVFSLTALFVIPSEGLIRDALKIPVLSNRCFERILVLSYETLTRPLNKATECCVICVRVPYEPLHFVDSFGPLSSLTSLLSFTSCTLCVFELQQHFERPVWTIFWAGNPLHFIPKSTRETEHDMKMLNSGKEWCQLSQANN